MLRMAAIAVSIAIPVLLGIAIAVMMMTFVPGPGGRREQHDAQSGCKSDGSFPHDYLHLVIQQYCCINEQRVSPPRLTFTDMGVCENANSMCDMTLIEAVRVPRMTQVARIARFKQDNELENCNRFVGELLAHHGNDMT